jgi:hypothetical protein
MRQGVREDHGGQRKSQYHQLESDTSDSLSAGAGDADDAADNLSMRDDGETPDRAP